MKTVIQNGKIILEDKIIEGYNLYFEDDKIIDITKENLPSDNIIDAKGNYVSPGFIEIHTHGAGGYDFLDKSEDAYIVSAKVHAEHGATSIVPTLTSVDIDGIKDAINIFKNVVSQEYDGANLLGLHAEGPYFAESQKGAQESRFIHPFDPEEYNEILKIGGKYIIRWSAAPELPGFEEFAKKLKEYEILASIGHSDADFDCASKAIEYGFTHMTHLYSGMSSVHRKNAFRYAGIVEAAYFYDNVSVEIIADGIHLPPALLKLIYKIKGPDRIALTTDSMRGAGMPEGESVLGNKENGLPVIIEDGVAKLLDRTAFAGSVATFDRLVRNMITIADVSLTDAVKMATITPARIMNIKNKGLIKEGYDADIIIFDENINIIKTIVRGNTVFTL